MSTVPDDAPAVARPEARGPGRARRMRTPDVASCWGTGGRSLRTPTSTARTRGSPIPRTGLAVAL